SRPRQSCARRQAGTPFADGAGTDAVAARRGNRRPRRWRGLRGRGCPSASASRAGASAPWLFLDRRHRRPQRRMGRLNMTVFHENPFKTAEDRLAAAALEVPERQAMIERLLYKYPVFKKGEKFIGDFHFPFKGGTHGRGKIGGLLGSSRAGKSTICTYYVA